MITWLLYSNVDGGDGVYLSPAWESCLIAMCWCVTAALGELAKNGQIITWILKTCKKYLLSNKLYDMALVLYFESDLVESAVNGELLL